MSLLFDLRPGIAVRVWLDRVRTDLVEHAMGYLLDGADGEASGTEVIWSHLPDDVLPEIHDFAQLKQVEREEQKTLSQALLLAAQSLFVEEHRALLQQLCDAAPFVKVKHSFIIRLENNDGG